MSGIGAKFSFSLGGAAPALSSPGGDGGGLSNMERLLAQAKTKSQPKPKPSANLFDDEDDEGPSHALPSLSGPSTSKAQASKPQIKQTSAISRAEKKAQQEALKIDSTVFDYDGVYDGMKAAEKRLEEKKKAETDERKPKYIENFLASAQTRRLDRLRAEEKMLSLEREKEGDEFADKEKFVTEAYKKQMEEVRRAEEEEKQREDALRKSKKGPGLTSFYKSMLDDEAEKHAAAMAAANGATSGGPIGPSLAIRPPSQAEEYEPEAEYDPFLAQEAKEAKSRPTLTTKDTTAGSSRLSEETGKQVEINDNGEVVDKRSLLKAGLNIMKKPKAELPNSLLTGQKSGQSTDGPYKSRAVGASATYQERMERERRRLADQMREEAERKKAQEEARLREEEELARKRREGDDGEALRKREEAKRRFLERKRQREEVKKDGNKRRKDDDAEED